MLLVIPSVASCALLCLNRHMVSIYLASLLKFRDSHCWDRLKMGDSPVDHEDLYNNPGKLNGHHIITAYL